MAQGRCIPLCINLLGKEEDMMIMGQRGIEKRRKAFSFVLSFSALSVLCREREDYYSLLK